MEKLFGRHPRWEKLKDLLLNGAFFPLKDLEENLRIEDLEAAFIRGNHKSAQLKEKILSKAMLKEIKKGWSLPIPESKFNKIPNLILSPMGVANHIGVTASGEFAPKDRVTHDLSFPGLISGESVNSRVKEEELEPIMFGHTLIRLIHYIVYLRSKYPNLKIWIRKEDLKSAF